MSFEGLPSNVIINLPGLDLASQLRQSADVEGFRLVSLASQANVDRVLVDYQPVAPFPLAHAATLDLQSQCRPVVCPHPGENNYVGRIDESRIGLQRTH